jgi:hypothetical protein
MADSLTITELQHTHEYYDAYKVFWDFLLASYEGIRALIAGNHALFRHERESQPNFERRQAEAYGFGYSQSIVDIFNFYLFKNPAKRDMGPMAEDKQWEMFVQDCDLYGAAWEHWLLETQRYAGILGHVGLLCDKTGTKFGNVAAEIKAQVYPYVARYFPQNILDWEYKRDENNRPYLAMVKLLDDDGIYRVWTTEEWATYEVTEEMEKTAPTVKDADTGATRGGGGTQDEAQKVEPLDQGPNPFINDTGRGEVPFVWLYNVKSRLRGIGVSDIKDVAYIDASVTRNLSEGEEVIKYGAFPMLRKPMKEKGTTPGDKDGKDEVGQQALLEWDPDLVAQAGDAGKTDWLEAAVKEPIDAILLWLVRKVEEIYRSSNAGGMAGTEIQTQAKSGTALKAEFQLLNSKLVSKGSNGEKAEKQILRFWLMWQKKEDTLEKISLEWPRTYDIENLAQDLENALTAKTIVMSATFKAAVQKHVVRQYMPMADNKMLKEIDDEIDKATEEAEKAAAEIAKASPFGGADTGGSKPGEGGTAGGKEPGAGKLVPIPGGKTAAGAEGGEE